jgi:RNA polymerase sigma-70 factor (ECF subfamily)
MLLEKRFELIAAADETSPSQHLLKNERLRRLAKALDDLPEDQRTAIELHHLAECSLAEAAAGMNRTPTSVAGLLRRGLKTLRNNLKGQEADFR